MNAYLWDGSGAPDADVARLESVLGEFQYKGRKARPPRALMAAIAAAFLISLGGIWMASTSRHLSSWQLSINGRVVERLRVGQKIDVGQNAQAVLESPATGIVEVGPESRVRLIEDRRGAKTFALEHGFIHALIWAQPRTFVVQTASARTVDLGCQYTLRVGHDGAGVLRVDTGWVAFTRRGVESFIPAGAVCETRPDRGPGTPWFEDASPAFVAAIQRINGGDNAAIADVLSSARPRDALSLWHLLTRVPARERGRVFDRLRDLAPLPQQITRDAIERGDTRALDQAWDALHLGTAAWWRGWERRW